MYWMMQQQFFWTLSFRGRRSRNKVSVGEPAEGSFAWDKGHCCIYVCTCQWNWLRCRRALKIRLGAMWKFIACACALRDCPVNMFSYGCMGSDNEEEHSKLWYALWLAALRESCDTWMAHMPLDSTGSISRLLFALLPINVSACMHYSGDAPCSNHCADLARQIGKCVCSCVLVVGCVFGDECADTVTWLLCCP